MSKKKKSYLIKKTKKKTYVWPRKSKEKRIKKIKGGFQ